MIGNCWYRATCVLLTCSAAFRPKNERPLPDGFQWRPESLCNDSLPSRSSDTLHGLHLIIAGTTIEPFLFKVNSSGGSHLAGFEIELLDKIAELLGFTYTIELLDAYMDMFGPEATDGTFTPMLILSTSKADLMIRASDPTAGRRQDIDFLEPSFPNNRRLVVKRIDAVPDTSLWQLVGSLVQPFTTRLWIVIICLYVFNSVTLYVLEHDQEDFKDENSVTGGLLHSLYLSACSISGIGAHNPCSMVGRFFSASWGIVLLLGVSWYTANLASISIVSATATTSVNSVEDLIGQQKTACAANKDLFLERYKLKYPSLRLRVVDEVGPFEQDDLLLRLLLNGECAGIIVEASSSSVVAWQASEETACEIEFVENVEIWSSAWALPKGNSACVKQTLDYGLAFMADNGVIDMLKDKYFGIAQSCPVPVLRPSGSADITDLSAVIGLHVVFGVLCLAAAFIKKLPHHFHPSLHPRGTPTPKCREEAKEAAETLAAEQSGMAREEEPEAEEEFVIVRHGDTETLGRIFMSSRASRSNIESSL